MDLTTAHLGKLFRGYLLPTVTASVSLAAYCIVDTIFIGIKTGRVGLAAVSIAIPIYTVFGALGLLLGIGTSTSVSVCRGEGKETEAQKIFTLGLLLTIIIGIGLSILSVLFLKPYARLLGATESLLLPTLTYMLPICIGSFAFLISKSLSIIIRNDQGPGLVMTAALVGNVTNVILDYILMFPLDMGILGASLATLCSPIVSLFILAAHFRPGGKSTLHLTPHCWQSNRLKRLLQNGAAASLEELSAGLVILLFNKGFLYWGSTLQVAAFAIISEIAYVARAIFDGISHAAQPILSVNYGARRYDRVNTTLKMAAGWGFGVALFLYGSFALFPYQIIGFFAKNDPELINTAVHAGYLYFTAFAFQGINIMLMYFFQSIEQARSAFFVALFRGVIFVLPIMICFGSFFGVTALWLTLTVAEAATTFGGIWLLRSYHQQEKECLQSGRS